MPYIKNSRRSLFANEIASLYDTFLQEHQSLSAGDLNYLFTKIIHTYIEVKGKNYQNFNDCLGALEGAKLELYRRSIAPYEDTKIEENGDV